MSHGHRTDFTDTDLSAWLDGEGDSLQRERVEAWLREQPEAAAKVRLWAADRDALQARLGPLAEAPLPPHWRRQVLQGGRRRLPLAWAASLLLAGTALGGVIGVGAMWRFPQAALGVQAQLPAALAPVPAWTRRAAVAHAVYAAEQRHPVEVDVAAGSPAEQQAQEQHLARWLSKRLAMPVRLYNLRPQGFTLVGGRLLPDAAGPSAQLMYQNAQGQRVTLYLRKPEPGVSTSFRYEQQGPLGLFYWVEEGYGCALVGQLPKERLLALADAIYQQFESDQAGSEVPRS